MNCSNCDGYVNFVINVTVIRENRNGTPFDSEENLCKKCFKEELEDDN